jgi:hypothetical protein
VDRLDNGDMIGIDRHRWIAGQSGVGACLIDDYACRRALRFVKDAMLEVIPALIGKPAIGDIDAAQGWVIGDECSCDGRWPSKKSQPVEQGSLPRTRVGCGGENDLGHAAEEVFGLFASVLLLLQIEQDLLDDQATEAVADKNDRAALEPWLAQQDFEDIDGPILERHGGPEPIGCRSLVSQSIDRNSIEVLGQPERPKRDILWCFPTPGVSAPGIVSVAAEAMDENDARSRRAAPTGDLDQS